MSTAIEIVFINYLATVLVNARREYYCSAENRF
jgi:hypothetical protein